MTTHTHDPDEPGLAVEMHLREHLNEAHHHFAVGSYVDLAKQHAGEHPGLFDRQPILRLALPGIPARCGYCGEESETWPLGVYGGQVNATCPACFSIVSPVVAVAGDGGHGGCTTIAEHQQLQQQVERLIDLVRQLTERITGCSAGHYHDATGYEDTLCQCPSPGTYAPQFRNAHITEENR